MGVQLGGFEVGTENRRTEELQPTWFVLGRLSCDGVCAAVARTFGSQVAGQFAFMQFRFERVNWFAGRCCCRPRVGFGHRVVQSGQSV